MKMKPIELKYPELVDIEIYTKVKVKKNEFGGTSRKMSRTAYFRDKWRFVWISKDKYNTLETWVNKNGELYKKYYGPALFVDGVLYIDIMPEAVNGAQDVTKG